MELNRQKQQNAFISVHIFFYPSEKKAACNCDPDQLKEVQGAYFFSTVPKVTYHLLCQIKDSNLSLEKGLLNLFNNF